MSVTPIRPHPASMLRLIVTAMQRAAGSQPG
jgi:hypothetical protein